MGLGREEQKIDIAARLEDWQRSGDERLWKLIISPEFGDLGDLRRLTKRTSVPASNGRGRASQYRALTGSCRRGRRKEQRRRLTHEPRVHPARDSKCRPAPMHSPDGYRTEFDAADAERREISESRFTLLDRRILREASNPNADFGPQYFEVVRNPTEASLSETARLRTQHEASRLAVLHRMGLAESTGGVSWLVRRDCEQVLRSMQRSADRQRTLAADGALLSDDRLPMTTLDVRDFTSIEGRILVHGEEEASGRSYARTATRVEA